MDHRRPCGMVRSSIQIPEIRGRPLVRAESDPASDSNQPFNPHFHPKNGQKRLGSRRLRNPIGVTHVC